MSRGIYLLAKLCCNKTRVKLLALPPTPLPQLQQDLQSAVDQTAVTVLRHSTKGATVAVILQRPSATALQQIIQALRDAGYEDFHQ